MNKSVLDNKRILIVDDELDILVYVCGCGSQPICLEAYNPMKLRARHLSMIGLSFHLKRSSALLQTNFIKNPNHVGSRVCSE